ncbi:MAG TPA: PA2169 family four-helix-bundle protein [Acidobacteriaceae bacterium]
MANSLDGSEKNRDMERVLLDVIKVLQDGQKGFADIGEHLKDDTLKRYFLAESLKRANFRAELENELHRAGMADVKESGTTAGALHRTWGDLKAKLGLGSDYELLATAEQGEDIAKKAYKDALEHDLPLPVRQLLTEQQAHVQNSHDFVRNHRDATKAAA